MEKDPSLSSQSPYNEILEKKESMSNDDLEQIPELFDVLLPAYPEISQTEYQKNQKCILIAQNILDSMFHSKI